MKETQKKDITTQPAQAAGENKMGILPIRPLLLSMAWPAILSMTISALYNIVDSYFVSAIGEGADEAVHALTLAFPIQMLMVAVGVGTGIGVSAWISQYLGMNNRERASRKRQIKPRVRDFASACLIIWYFCLSVSVLPVFLFPVTRKREARSTRRQSSICRLSASALSF